MYSQLAAAFFGFGCGYAVREVISRRRRAAAREKHQARNGPQDKQAHMDELKVMAKLHELREPNIKQEP
jgi:hypothetical protein